MSIPRYSREGRVSHLLFPGSDPFETWCGRVLAWYPSLVIADNADTATCKRCLKLAATRDPTHEDLNEGREK